GLMRGGNSGSCPTRWKFDDAAEPAAGAAGDPAAGAAATIAGSHIMAKTLTKTSGRRIPIPSLTGTGPGRKRPGVANAIYHRRGPVSTPPGPERCESPSQA